MDNNTPPACSHLCSENALNALKALKIPEVTLGHLNHEALTAVKLRRHGVPEFKFDSKADESSEMSDDCVSGQPSRIPSEISTSDASRSSSVTPVL